MRGETALSCSASLARVTLLPLLLSFGADVSGTVLRCAKTPVIYYYLALAKGYVHLRSVTPFTHFLACSLQSHEHVLRVMHYWYALSRQVAEERREAHTVELQEVKVHVTEPIEEDHASEQWPIETELALRSSFASASASSSSSSSSSASANSRFDDADDEALEASECNKRSLLAASMHYNSELSEKELALGVRAKGAAPPSPSLSQSSLMPVVELVKSWPRDLSEISGGEMWKEAEAAMGGGHYRSIEGPSGARHAHTPTLVKGASRREEPLLSEFTDDELVRDVGPAKQVVVALSGGRLEYE